MNFDTNNQTFEAIMGNGRRYFVPKFQRDYAWDHEQWEDLWDDLMALEKGEIHYMGYLVFQPVDETKKLLKIIDGQQRLTTISILVIAAISHLQDLIKNGVEKDDTRLKFMQEKFVGATNITTLLTEPKLTLNRSNKTHFQNYICSLKKPPIRKVKESNKKLGKAVTFFYDKLDKKELNTGEKLAAFVEDYAARLLFTTISVDSDLNAYKVFETLNARGVQLSVPDLLKNYIFSMIDGRQEQGESEIEALEESWEEILSQLGSNNFTKFIKADWESRYRPTTERQLFKQIKRKILDGSGAFSYLEDLRPASELYAALLNPDDEFWQRPEFKKAKEHLLLLNMFGLKQHHALLMSVFRHFEDKPKKFIKVLGYIAIIAMRYNIIGRRQSNTQERLYNTISLKLNSEPKLNLENIKRLLQEIYIDDESFLSDFKKKEFAPTFKKKIRFILARLEQYKSDGIPVKDAELTLEHILPIKPGINWQHINDEILERYVNRLGNMTLLTTQKNKDLGNKSFDDKQDVFKDSGLKITKHCASYEEWSEISIENNQEWLANIAVQCWNIEF